MNSDDKYIIKIPKTPERKIVTVGSDVDDGLVVTNIIANRSVPETTIIHQRRGQRKRFKLGIEVKFIQLSSFF